MTETRGVGTSHARWLRALEPQLSPTAAAVFAPLGFRAEDRLELGPGGGALRPGGAAASGLAGDPELVRSMRSRMQQLHQTESSPAARAQGPDTVRVLGKTFRRGQGDELWLHLESRGRSYRKWAKRNPALAKRIGPHPRVNKMIRKVKRGFNKASSPLKKYAKNFVVAGYLSGYDPRFIAAFAAQESGWGRSTPNNAPYNFWGWSVYTGNQSSDVTRPFKKPGRAFRYYGRQLRKKYGGAKSVYSRIWAPYAADPNHERIIGSILKDFFRGNPSNIRFRRAMGF